MKWLTAIFALFLAAVVFAANTGAAKSLFKALRQIPLGDKVAHVVLVGIMSLLLNLSLSAARFRWRSIGIQKGTLVLFVIATLDELSNLFLSHRNFSLGDLASNYIGIFCFGWLAAWLVARSRTKAEAESPKVEETP